MNQRLDAHLAKEDRYALEHEYWLEMGEAAANDGTDIVTLLEKTPFEDWLRKRREGRI